MTWWIYFSLIITFALSFVSIFTSLFLWTHKKKLINIVFFITKNLIIGVVLLFFIYQQSKLKSPFLILIILSIANIGIFLNLKVIMKFSRNIYFNWKLSQELDNENIRKDLIDFINSYLQLGASINKKNNQTLKEHNLQKFNIKVKIED
ncbi:hypothetical protein [Mycoplasma sp. 3686d]|uniref:hypothetical protein n=1 Tax=Mycoplasma sp. 3686d TaxID=2967300 RepID=UPI00211C137C|nr:hypothetical protein [Mycoplasma sp. 3686d]UUM24572.1 hypothetical protein NPA12_02620 [Mycoplasma sp. 3686d]